VHCRVLENQGPAAESCETQLGQPRTIFFDVHLVVRNLKIPGQYDIIIDKYHQHNRAKRPKQRLDRSGRARRKPGHPAAKATPKHRTFTLMSPGCTADSKEELAILR